VLGGDYPHFEQSRQLLRYAQESKLHLHAHCQIGCRSRNPIHLDGNILGEDVTIAFDDDSSAGRLECLHDAGIDFLARDQSPWLVDVRSVGNTLGLLPESLGDENKTCHDHQDERKLRGKQRLGLPRNRCDKAAQTVTPQSPARARKGAQCAGPACCR